MGGGGEPQAAQDLVVVRHAGQRRGPVGVDGLPERPGHQAGAVDEDRRSGDEVAVQHGQAVAVVQRQGRGGHVVLTDAQGLGNRPGVGEHGGPGEADHLRVAGRTAGCQQHRQVGMRLRSAGVLAHPGRSSGRVRLVAGRRLAVGAQDGRRPEALDQVGEEHGLEGGVQQCHSPAGGEGTQVPQDARDVDGCAGKENAGRQGAEPGGHAGDPGQQVRPADRLAGSRVDQPRARLEQPSGEVS